MQVNRAEQVMTKWMIWLVFTAVTGNELNSTLGSQLVAKRKYLQSGSFIWPFPTEQLESSLFKRHLTSLDFCGSALGHFCTDSLPGEIERVDPRPKGLPWKFDRSRWADKSGVFLQCGAAGVLSFAQKKELGCSAHVSCFAGFCVYVIAEHYNGRNMIKTMKKWSFSLFSY